MSARFRLPSSRLAQRAACCGARRSAGSTLKPSQHQPRQSTIFDLASLTKVIATTTLVMRLVERGALALDHPIRRVDSRVARERSRGCDRTRAPDPQFRPERVASVFPRLHRAPGISARHCVAAARVSARLTVHLQRSGIHAARLHRRRRGRTPFRRASGGDAGVGDIRAAHVQSARRAALVDRADRERPVARTAARRRGPRRKLLGAWWRGRARRIVRLCNRRSETLRERYSVRSPGVTRDWHAQRRFDCSSRAIRLLPDRARLDGTRCCRRLRAGRRCRRPRSVTRDLREPRCGSIRSGICTWCF